MPPTTSSRPSAVEIDARIAHTSVVRPRRAAPRAALAAARPRQWIKNGLVIAAPGAAGALGHDGVLWRVSVAFVAFCMLASGIYLINDVRDAEEDRLHPRKRHRPVAAGELEPTQATLLGLTLMVLGLALCGVVRPLLGLVGAGYLSLSLSYTLVWRYVLILDVVTIGGGFVLRAVAGGVAAPVVLSRWFLLVISASAVFVASAKRHAELRRTDRQGGPRRRVLESYSVPLLRLMLGASAAIALFAYCGWALTLPTVHGIPWRPMTIVPFALGLLRYGDVVRRGGAEAPEEVLLGDGVLQLTGIAWVVLFALGVQAAS